MPRESSHPPAGPRRLRRARPPKTLPLARHFATHVPGDPRDPLLIAWILSWDVHALATDPLRLFDANIFFLAERALAFSDHLLGVIPIFAPAYVATGSPVVGYNTLFVLSFALSGLSGFCLAYHLTRAFWPSVVGGTLFGFAPYRFGQIGHLQLLSFFWTPWALLFLDRFLRARRWRDLAGFAVFYWLQVLSSLYLAFMATVAAAVYAAYHAFAVDRRFLRAAAPRPSRQPAPPRFFPSRCRTLPSTGPGARAGHSAASAAIRPTYSATSWRRPR